MGEGRHHVVLTSHADVLQISQLYGCHAPNVGAFSSYRFGNGEVRAMKRTPDSLPEPSPLEPPVRGTQVPVELPQVPPAVFVINTKSGSEKGQEQREIDISQLEEVGGDPSFLMDLPGIQNNVPVDDNTAMDNTHTDTKSDTEIAELEEMGGDPSFLMNLPGMENVAKDENPSLLDDPVANGGDDGFQTLEQEQREAEIAEIIEMGGDPSFLMDVAAPGMNIINDEDSLLDDAMANGGDDGFQTQEQMQREADIAELLELGGDPSFLMDAPAVPPAPSKFEPNDQLSTDRVYSPEKFQVDPDEAAALEEAGGDPFFLPSLDGESTTPRESAASSAPEPLDPYAEALEAMGGDPSFLEPPIASTSARDIFANFEAGPPTDQEATPKLASDPSFLLQYVQNQEDPAGTVAPSPNLDITISNEKSDSEPQNLRQFLRKSPITNEVLEDETLGEEEALLEVGGDPAFLDSFDEHADSNAYDLELQRADIEDVGGDPSFL